LEEKLNTLEQSLRKSIIDIENKNTEILLLKDDLTQNEKFKESKIKEFTNSHENTVASVKGILSQ